MLSERENFLRALNGEIPEYVPRYDILWTVRPSMLWGDLLTGAGKDIFGVEWTSEGSVIAMPVPKPGHFILNDVRKWRDVIKFPDFADVDWADMAKKDLEHHDPSLPRGGGLVITSFFQAFISFMGFTEGLVACVEEPVEVRELLEHMCDYYLGFADKMLYYYKPDYIMFSDDIATERSPFISLDTFHDLFEPVWRRYIKYFKDRGYLAVHHNCGKFDAFIDDVVDMGYNAWDPAQVSNDLPGVKKKYGRRLMLIGCFDPLPLLSHHNPTEEQCRAAMKKTMDTFAPDGGFAVMLGSMDSHNIDPKAKAWVIEEYEKSKGLYYQ